MPTKPIDPKEVSLSVAGRLRLAAEIIAAVPRLDHAERSEVIAKSLELVASAQWDLIDSLLVQNRADIARASAELAARAFPRRAGE